MVTSIELQVISRLLTTDSEEEIIQLCSFDESYYSVFKPHISFILNHHKEHGNIPDVFTFQSNFPDCVLVKVGESITFLTHELRKNKQHILLLETFNKLKDLGEGDVTDAWGWLSGQCDRAARLDSSQLLDLVKDANKRSSQILELNKQQRIQTGFEEIDKVMYGGLSTIEELVIVLARTNTGKSWVGVKMMEAAQRQGFPVLYYSPEMQGAFLGTRFDTWRGHFQNSQLYRGNYDEQYFNYLQELSKQETSAYILEDKDAPEGNVNVELLRTLVKKHSIKLLIVDGLSYMEDSGKNNPDHIKYKNLCNDLFRLSKQYSCAVVVMMQANRESLTTKDDKGEVFPNMFHIEGSDHPARIATQVFAMRQIFDKHVLDIRLEKSRMADNSKPEFSYSWDINTGNMQYLPGNYSDTISTVITPKIVSPAVSDAKSIDLDDLDEEVEF